MAADPHTLGDRAGGFGVGGGLVLLVGVEVGVGDVSVRLGDEQLFVGGHIDYDCSRQMVGQRKPGCC